MAELTATFACMKVNSDKSTEPEPDSIMFGPDCWAVTITAADAGTPGDTKKKAKASR
jgi:hypothetical protein